MVVCLLVVGIIIIAAIVSKGEGPNCWLGCCQLSPVIVSNCLLLSPSSNCVLIVILGAVPSTPSVNVNVVVLCHFLAVMVMAACYNFFSPCLRGPPLHHLPHPLVPYDVFLWQWGHPYPCLADCCVLCHCCLHHCHLISSIIFSMSPCTACPLPWLPSPPTLLWLIVVYYYFSWETAAPVTFINRRGCIITKKNRGSSPENDIFLNGPKIISKCSNPLY